MNELERAIMDLECHCLQKEDCGFTYGTYIPFVESTEYRNAINVIKQALTPPTEEEVCKALSEYIKYDWENVNGGMTKLFMNEQEEFVFTLKTSGDFEFTITDVTKYKNGTKEYCITESLPPHLITMIGKFYEGVEVER